MKIRKSKQEKAAEKKDIINYNKGMSETCIAAIKKCDENIAKASSTKEADSYSKIRAEWENNLIKHNNDIKRLESNVNNRGKWVLVLALSVTIAALIFFALVIS